MVAQGPPRPEVAVGGIAVVDEALLLVRRANPPQAGRWSVPGGRVERGETLAAAVERELAEETGVEVRCGDLVGWVERIGPDHHFVILDFAVTVVGDQRGDWPPVPAAGGDASEAAWVPRRALSSLDLVDGLEAFLTTHGVLAP